MSAVFNNRSYHYKNKK